MPARGERAGAHWAVNEQSTELEVYAHSEARQNGSVLIMPLGALCPPVTEANG